MNWEVGIDIYTPLFMKQITNEKLLYSMGNSTQCSCGDLNVLGQKSKKVGICVYVLLTHLLYGRK